MTDAARWVATPADLAALLTELREEPEIALDTEFHRERTYYPALALVQLAWPGGVALVDPMAVDVRPMETMLTGPATIVAHAAGQDLEVLERACGCVPRQLFDTQIAAGFIGYSTPSLATLADQLLQIHLPKGDRMTDWRQRPLTDAQRDYGAADVAHLLEIADILRRQLTKRGRLEWAIQECETLHATARAPQDPETAWWKVKEVRHLRGKSRSVAQEVAAWRERTAAVLDRPVRTVLPDLGVLAVAAHPPASIDDLRNLRGMEGRVPKGEVAAGLMAAVQRGLNLAPEALRSPPADDVERGMRPAANLASAWVGQLARDLDFDASLLATRADLHALLRSDPEARLAHGWRSELVGEPVRRLVAGEAAVAFDGRGGLILEERSYRPAAPIPPTTE